MGGENERSIGSETLIDRVCEGFETAWKSEGRPTIEEYVERLPTEAREAGLREMIALEVHLRSAAGEPVSRSEYHQRFPEQVATVDAAFASLDTSDPNASPRDSQIGGTVAAPRPGEQITDSLTERRIGRFVVEKRLGRGTFGAVYLAHDEQLKRAVAIKVPHAHLVARREVIDEYFAEARILAGLDHEHIVPVYDAGSTDKVPCYVVSKYVEE